MNKIIFRFALFNLLIGVVLFILYRVVISGLEPVNTNFFERFLSIMDLFLSLGLSTIYVIIIAVSTPVVFF